MTFAASGVRVGDDRVSPPVSVLPQTTGKLDSSSRDLRPHPLRSLAFSTACHALVAIVLMLIPVSALQRGAQRRSATRAVTIFVMPAIAPPVAWDEPDELIEELAALDPLVELPDDFVEPELPRDTFFDEPLRDEGRREVPLPAAAPFDELPEDLFERPTEVVEPVETEAVEPEPVVEPKPPEPEVVPDAPLEEPTPPEDTEAEDRNSEETPETEGPAEEAESSGAGHDESPLLEAPAPRYPASARAQGKQGTVWLAIDVDSAGSVLRVQVKTSSGHRVLDEAARQIVLDRWRFRPRKEDEPELRRYLEPVTFSLVRR